MRIFTPRLVYMVSIIAHWAYLVGLTEEKPILHYEHG